MFPKIEYGSNSGQLLHDIEEISKALFVHKTFSRASTPLPGGRSKSVEINRILDSDSISNPTTWKEDQLHKDKKPSSIWNWKKPLKALTHIRQHRFNCCFFLYVHSIEGLPVNLEDFRLCLFWEKKDEILQTQQARISKGMAELDETLMLKCCVHARRNGPHSSAKYDEKPTLLYASVVEAPGLDIGKHRVDLTRLLPLTLEELEGEKSSGKWTTSYNLTGKARGATINVSFGFSVIPEDLSDSSGHMKLSDLINLTKNQSRAAQQGAGLASSGNGMLRRVGSVPSNLNSESFHATQSVDLKICREVLLCSEMELPKSISFLCQKFDEGNVHSSEELNMISEHKSELKLKTDLEHESAEKTNRYEYDSADYIVIERGIETTNEEWLKPQEGNVEAIVYSPIETIDVDEIMGDEIVDEDSKNVSKNDLKGSFTDEVVVKKCKYEVNSLCTEEFTEAELESAFSSLLTSESGSFLSTNELVEHENCTDIQSNNKTNRMMKKSVSLDDFTESVADDFLNMLGVHTSSGGSSDNDDPDSPRGQLLRKFEKEALASGSFILDFNTKVQEVECDSVVRMGSGCRDLCEDFDFSSVFPTVEVKHGKMRQPLKIRRKANLLEDLETAKLMEEWGLNEKAFQNSPRMYSIGFGSPIELLPEEPHVLTPLGDGFGPITKTRDGGYLRSMKPSIFTNAKHDATLIMQISSPVVFPAEMGSDIMEILQHMASVGVEKLSMQAHKLMPLEYITGKTMQQVAQEATPRLALSERQNKLRAGQGSFGGTDLVFSSGWRYNDMSSCSSFCGNTGSNYMTLEDLIPLAMDEIEALSIEGLRIQSGMATEEASSSITPHAVYKKVSSSQGKYKTFSGFLSLEGTADLQTENNDTDNDANDLMALSITLNEWLRIDVGLTEDADKISEHTIKILAAHRAHCIDFSGRLMRDVNEGKPYGRVCGLFGNNLTLAFMVQLGDPLRNYEPVGDAMLAIILVERSFVHDNEEESMSEASYKFKFIETNLTGLNTEPGKKKQLWGTTTQRQSGKRWLLRSGMGKTNKSPPSLSKSMAIQVKLKVKHDEYLWSISSCHHNTSLMQHMRNPNVVFLNDNITSDADTCSF